jgi:hypothetical protein
LENSKHFIINIRIYLIFFNLEIFQLKLEALTNKKLS